MISPIIMSIRNKIFPIIISLMLLLLFGSYLKVEHLSENSVHISPNRSLQWRDFQQVAQIRGKASINALCLSTCDVEIKKIHPKNDHVVLEVKAIIKHQKELSQVSRKFLARANKETKSQVLHHENGHFLIAQIIGYRIVRDVKQAKFDKKKYKAELNNIIRANFKEWNALDRQYDKETTKPRNIEAQKKWDQFFQSELAALKR